MKRMFGNSFYFMALAAFALSFNACVSGNQEKQKDVEKDIVGAAGPSDEMMEEFAKSKLIFYSLPSPLETAMLIKRAGASFNEELLNPLENIEKYTTNKKMAINLGIYSADLSYTSLFDQTQSSIKYMANAKRLADGLGILDAIDEGTIHQLEENMNNRDVILDIISETFMSSNAYLTENDRPALAAMVLVGGWVEGLYLATKLSNGSLENNKKLIDRIIYQKLSLITVINLLEQYKEDEDVASLLAQMNQLQVIFEKVKIVNTSKVEVETDADKKTTTLKAESETHISDDVFDKLLKKVDEIRADFIS